MHSAYRLYTWLIYAAPSNGPFLGIAIGWSGTRVLWTLSSDLCDFVSDGVSKKIIVGTLFFVSDSKRGRCDSFDGIGERSCFRVGCERNVVSLMRTDSELINSY